MYFVSQIKKLFILTLLIFISSNVFAQNLYWAGFAFIGNKDQNFRYPIAYQIFENDKTILSATLKKTLKNLKRSDLEIIYDLGKISSGDSKAIGFGLVDESLERIVGDYGVTTNYSIYGQVLVFDFNEKKVISNYPVLARSTFVTKKMPDNNEDKEKFEAMYLNLNDEASIFSQWARMLEKIRVNETKNIATIGVRNIILSDKVQGNLPERLKNNGVFKSKTAQELEASIATFHNVPLIPYTIGEALGGKGESGLSTRFTDGASLELKLDPKDYVFDITIRGFGKRETESDTQVQHLWATFIELQLLEDFENSVIFDQNFRKIEEAIFAKRSNVKILDNWVVYEIVLSNLIFDVIEQIKLKDNKKIKELLKKDVDVKTVKEKFKKIEEKFAQCI